MAEVDLKGVATGGGGGGGGNSTIINTVANPVIIRPLTCSDLITLCASGVPIDPRIIRFLAFGTDKVDVSGSTISLTGGTIDVSDRCARLLGQLCVAGSPIDPRTIRALAFLTDKVDVSGSTISLTGGTIDVTDRCARLLGQLCVGGVAIDPRVIRALTNADVVTADGSNAVALQQLAVTNDLITRPFGSQGQQLQQKAATFELLTDPVDRATRLLGVTYGSQGQQLQQLAGTFELLTRPFGSQAQQLLQRAVTFDLEVQLRTAGVEYDARQIRNLVFATDKVDVSGSIVTVSGAVTATITQLTPISKATVHNTALPAAGADLFGVSLAPTNTPTFFRITCAFTIAGQLTVDIINGGNEQRMFLNGGSDLSPSVIYTFEVPIHAGDTMNLEYSTTGGTIQVIRVQEIDASTA